MEARPFLLALLALVGLVIAGAILMGLGITLIGIIVFLVSIPAALVVWLAAD